MSFFRRIFALVFRRRQKTAGIPTMITREMRKGLLEIGVLPSEIREMTPQQAWDRLNQRRSRKRWDLHGCPETLGLWP